MATENQSLPNLQDTLENQDNNPDHQETNQSEAKLQESSSYSKVQIILDNVQDDDDDTNNAEKITIVNGNQHQINEDEESIQVAQEDDIEDVEDDQYQNDANENTSLPSIIDQDRVDTQQNQHLLQNGSISSLKMSNVPQNIYGHGHSLWPLDCSIKLDFNVNGQYGGCTSLLIASSTYNRETVAALLMLRSGFDSNHYRLSKIHQIPGKKHQSTFGIHPDVKGNLILDSGCGANFVTMLSNHAHQTSLQCGLVCIPSTNELKCDLPLRVDESEGGAAILLCSAPCESRVKAKLSAFGALYLLRFGLDGNNFHGEKLYGDAQWKFSTKGSNGRLRISGPKDSSYCLYHNRPDRYQDVTDRQVFRNFVYHTQTMNGREKTKLINLPSSIKHCAFIVLCSYSYGHEDQTISALYLLTVSSENTGKRKVRAGYFKGSGNKSGNSNVWKFSLSNSCIYASGLSGPCRYALLSNISDSQLTHGMEQIDHNQHTSLAISNRPYLSSHVEIDNEKIAGWLSWSCTLCVTVDEKEVFRIKKQELIQENNGKFTFSKLWPSQQRILGLHLIRAFAVDSTEDVPGVKESEMKIELNGSPMQLIRQPNYVGIAVNCAGPSYENAKGVVYTSEDIVLLSYEKGFEGTNLKGVAHNTALHQTIMNTEDGLLYSTYRTSNVAADEKVIKYELPMENGSYILRLHYIEPTIQCCILQGMNATKEVQQVMKENDGELELGNTANYINLPISIINGKFSMTLFEQPLCAFALFHGNKKKSVMPYVTSTDEHQQITNYEHELPITYSLCKKEMFQVGWSDNLLRNYNGQLDNKMFWKMGGDWKVFYGSKGKERALIFVTSHMYCRKFQEILLTDYFPVEFWDKSPDIQASEWYSGGPSSNKTDCYEFKVKLLRHGRKVVREYTSGQITDLNPNKWNKETVTFRNYGTGVRIIHFESSGQNIDGKMLHQGPIMAMASVRVKLRNIPRAGDVLEDITLGKTKSTKIGRRRRILHQVFLDNKGLMSDDEILNRQIHSASLRLRRNSTKLLSEYSLNTSNSDKDLDKLPFKESIIDSIDENESKNDEVNGGKNQSTDEIDDRIITATYQERRKSRASFESLIQELDKRYLPSHGTVIYDILYSKWNYKCNHPEVIEAMYTLGYMYEKEMRLDDAIYCFKDAIKRQIRTKSTKQKLLLVRGLLGLGSVLSTQKNLLESKRVIFRALEVATDFLGSDHPYVTSILNMFGQLSYKQNCYREALTFYTEDLVVTCKKFGIVHPRTAGILNNIALAYADLQKDNAEAVYSIALSILGDYYDDTPNIHVAITRFNLGCFYQNTNMHQRAEFQFKTAANLFETLLGSSHPYTEEAMQSYQDSHAI